MAKNSPPEVQPRPNREGIYPADTWRQSNLGYEKDEPQVSGKWVQIDVTGWYDYERSLRGGAK